VDWYAEGGGIRLISSVQFQIHSVCIGVAFFSERAKMAASTISVSCLIRNRCVADTRDPTARLLWAARLDRIADAELSFGRVLAAERISCLAAELRASTP
jgi:hypothetical protein